MPAGAHEKTFYFGEFHTFFYESQRKIVSQKFRTAG